MFARLVTLAQLVSLMLPINRVAPSYTVDCGALRSVTVTALAQGAGPSLLVGTLEGQLYRRADARSCWVRIHAYPRGVEIGTLVASPGFPHTVIAGASFKVTTASGGVKLYRSDDDGRTWRDGTTGLPRTPIVPVAVAVSARGTLVLSYICPQDQNVTTPRRPYGLARSVDGGRSWHSVGPAAGALTARGVVALNGGRLLALQAPTGGTGMGVYYRSRDDGRTWRAVGQEPFALNDIASLAAIPWTATGVLAGYGLSFFRPQVYRSLDGGAHWARVWYPRSGGSILGGFVASMIALPRTRALLLTDSSSVYRSTDGGSTWTPTGVGLGGAGRIWTLYAATDRATAYAGAQGGLYRSADGGLTWQAL